MSAIGGEADIVQDRLTSEIDPIRTSARRACGTLCYVPSVGIGDCAMKRREFIGLAGGSVAAWPLAARAQQQPKLPTIGFLGPTSLSAWSSYVSAFIQRLGELGWADGRTVAIEYRWADGREERYGEIAAEFVRNKVNVIVTGGSSGAAAKRATSAIPIVLAVSNDPVGDGLVASLARPGGNITGLSVLAPELAGKRLENLRQVLPGLRRLAVLGNAAYPAAVLEMSELQTTARKLGLEVDTLAVRTAEDIATAIETLKGRSDALYVSPDSLTATNSVRIGALALKAQIPTMHGVREFVEDGGLMSYGPNLADLFRRAGDYVDKILRGVKPDDLPIELPTKFELVINLKTAKALGVAVPEAMLVRADEVIE
jgi:putative tryptophan/tyrosine transport system substrate-binding protein